ncbi:uncharacterized protein VTP21DRAFT_1851 [Calcarisporiella thermophila]|uniref:uncharacterized protein n=1 Tax=Calcarisporiella thermophila TaxID=911321 RepID=UPI0037432CA8
MTYQADSMHTLPLVTQAGWLINASLLFGSSLLHIPLLRAINFPQSFGAPFFCPLILFSLNLINPRLSESLALS